MKDVFVGLVLGGVLALLAGMLLSRIHWRHDIAPYGRRTRFFEVTLHPDRYAENAPLGLIRVLSALGALLLAGALVLVLAEIVQTTVAP